MGAGQKIPFSKFLSHISYNDKTWHSHTFPKEDQKKKKKKKKSRDTLGVTKGLKLKVMKF